MRNSWRTITLILFFGILYSLLFFNAYKLQIIKGDYYLSLAHARDTAGGILEAQRGNVYFTDKNNNSSPAAINKSFPVIYAVPTEIQKNAEQGRESMQSYAEKLNSALKVAIEDLEKKLTKKDDQYELLVQKAAAEEVAQVRDLNLKGVYIKNQVLRYYPLGDLAAHVLGFVSPVNENESAKLGNAEVGRYGVELYFDDSLSGEPGEIKGDRLIEPEKGGDIRLTIDREIQAQSEEILKKLVNEYKASGGTVIIEEPKTGKILAMASFPNFDPNNYSQSKIENFLNPAVEAVYEPGSILKVVTMAAGIDSGKITPETTYYDTGFFTANNKTISNWDYKTHGPYGKATMTNVLEHSINTGAVFAERKTGHDVFYNYLTKFGMNELTGITLPGEVKGSIANLKKGKDIDFATAAYGQGISITPVRLISAISAIANNGILMRPYILANKEPQSIRRVIAESTAKTVTQMMVSAVDKNKVAAISGYSVAGKTGTAFVPLFGQKGYSDEVINTYVGFAPASDAKFIILIKLDKPAGAPVAALTVVPSFQKLAQFILNYYNIAPDRI
jgi:cell division protein FtsI/penicillin-binding protein 2